MKISKSNDVLGTVNRGNPAESGLCTLCRADCAGKCEVWLSSLRGREILYPRSYGKVTAGSDNITHVGVSYNSLRIQGYNYGSLGLAEGKTHDPDNCAFPDVNVETSFGNHKIVKAKMPIMTGALGSTKIAETYWDSFAIGCSLVGVPIVIGENVVGVDSKSVMFDGKIISAPELDRRIDTYLRYNDGYGAVLVQLNVEDSRNKVAEYLSEKYGDKVLVELKWGQGAKDIGGEIEVFDLEQAMFLKNRGYIVDPDPELEEVQEAFNHGSIKSFARHSRLGYTDLSEFDQVRENFKATVDHIRSLGFKGVTLKTGAYGMEALAMAIKLAGENEIDLLTIDGAGGGTGMSPWNMMESWGVPSILLHSKAYQYASMLQEKGQNVPDLSFAGGFAREDHIFKAMALGAPFSKIVCMGRALMIPGFLGSNIEGVLNPKNRDKVGGNWEKLPKTVSDIGKQADELFAGYYDVRKKIGSAELKNIPYGAIAFWTMADKLKAGLQQFLAGTRKFTLSEISRNDLAAGNRETEKETGITFITDALDDKARQILNS
ncbi:glutamate synthase-related protein [Desulfonatronovibrio magnus]|uniref:glutamate synthase-related protein n=1 Tax=Desulfonatronovibrio magnus TaxID=698827 RepID=UPI0005EAF955|nr:glutamate synthase-related protein [Desulfonatronovibrio magnus]